MREGKASLILLFAILMTAAVLGPLGPGIRPLSAQEAVMEPLKSKPAATVARAARLVSKEAKEVEIISKELQGRVSARGPNGLALEFGRDVTKRSSQEIWFPYVTDIKLQGYKSLQEIEEGDTILAVYEEAEDMSKRTLTGVRLLMKKPPEEEEASEEEEDGAETGETGENGDS